MAELPAQLDASVDSYAERCTMHVGSGLARLLSSVWRRVAVGVLVWLRINVHVISLCYTRSRECKIRYQSLCVVRLRSDDNDIPPTINRALRKSRTQPNHISMQELDLRAHRGDIERCQTNRNEAQFS
jgi:hypothetical protein